jgi:hypothetical protein
MTKQCIKIFIKANAVIESVSLEKDSEKGRPLSMQKALLSESLSNFHLSHFILFEIEMQGAMGPLGAPVQKVWCLLGTKGSTD